MTAAVGQRLEGAAGWAQQVESPPARDQITVTSWFMHMPNQAPSELNSIVSTRGGQTTMRLPDQLALPGKAAWEEFLMTVTSLAPFEGVPEARLEYPGAQYAVLVAALTPERGPVPEDPATWLPMVPVNVEVQFDGLDWGQARQLGAQLAKLCVAGTLLVETQTYVQPAQGPPKMMYIELLLGWWKEAVAANVALLKGEVPATYRWLN